MVRTWLCCHVPLSEREAQMSRLYLRLLAAGATCALALLLSSAAMATPAPTLTLGTGPSPVESIATQLLASGTTLDSQTSLSATIKPTGGQGCGPNVAADESAGGTVVFNRQTLAEGPFSNSVNRAFQSAGSYLFCAWLNDEAESEKPVVAEASLTFTVRAPHLALSIAAPATVLSEQTFQVLTTAQAEAERPVSEYLLPNTSRGCAANAAAAGSETGEIGVYWPLHGTAWPVIGGPFTESINENLQTGQYLVCAYVEYPTSQSPPEITASTLVTVVAPPPPCVVPTLSAAVKLATAERALTAAGCTVGKITNAASRRIRAGYVSALSPAPGTKLPSGTAVTITISTGPPCVVPHIAAGSSLRKAERHLRLAHCAVGKVRSSRSSHQARGRVLRLGARAGQVLRSGAPIEVVISRGPH